MAKSGNNLGELVAMPVISRLVQDANSAVIAETPTEKIVLRDLIKEIKSQSDKRP